MKNQRTAIDTIKKQVEKATKRLAVLTGISTPKKSAKDTDEENELMTKIPLLQAEIIQLDTQIKDL